MEVLICTLYNINIIQYTLDFAELKNIHKFRKGKVQKFNQVFMCSIKVSKNTFRRNFFKNYPTSFSKLMEVSLLNYLRKMTRNSSN